MKYSSNTQNTSKKDATTIFGRVLYNNNIQVKKINEELYTNTSNAPHLSLLLALIKKYKLIKSKIS